MAKQTRKNDPTDCDDAVVMTRTSDQLKELQKIPGVGKSIAQDFLDIGISSINDLKNRDPEALYNQLQECRKHHIDRCVLYVFRCAVYFASESNHNPKLLKWWSWKD